MTNEEAIKIINNMPNYKPWEVEALAMAIKALKQEPKTGHWIYDKSIENWKCSECGETPKTLGYVGDEGFMKEHFKFCNHCGAKMESEV